MADGILYKAEPMPNGQKVRIARDAESGKVLDAVALPPKRLRYKAIKRRQRTR